MNLGPTQPPVQWVSVSISPGIKRSGREADLWTPPSAVVKNPLQFMSSRKARWQRHLLPFLPHTSSQWPLQF